MINRFTRGKIVEKGNFFFAKVALLAIGFLCLLVFLAPVNNAQNADPLAGLEYVEGQVIIKFVNNATENQKRELRSTLNSVSLRKFSLIGAELVQISGMSVEEAIDSFKDDPRVLYVEPNYIWHADIIPNDPYFDLLWGMHNTGQTGGTPDADIDAVEAWNISTGDSIIIGVIDTGVDTAHVDLLGNIWTNPGEIPNNGLDDDSNGYVDDMHGWDFVNWDNGPIDDNGHGTHCSGTIAGVGNNSVGVAGVCWSARIMALKFLNAGGSGNTANAILAVEYATMMGANLTSNSWGGGSYSQALKDAIDSAGAQGMLFVAAAGNSRSNNDAYPHYPSSYNSDNVIAVAATDHNDELADEATWGSSYGLTSVDLGAPGVSIYSTIPGGGYSYKGGTSMATPHVSGAAALIWSEYPALDHLQVKDRIMSMADSIPALTGKCVTGSRLNLFMAMAEPDSTPPSPILDLAVTKAEATRINLSWTATGDDSGTGTAAYYDFRYSLSPIDSSNFDLATQVSGEPEPQPAGSAETFLVMSLDFNTSYYFAVQAFDEWNNSSGVSNSPGGTTLGPPDIQVSPDSLSDSLFTNGSSTQGLNVANLEEGELFYEIEVTYPTVLEASGSMILPAPISFVTGEAGSGHESRTILEEAEFDITGEKVTAGTKDVLLVYADNGASALKSILEGYPDMGLVDLWYAGPSGGTIPLLSDLGDYDVVVAWNNQAWADMYAIGDVLADYIDGGGAVVTTVNCWSAVTFASHGRYFDERRYSPFRYLGEALFNLRTLGWYDSSHPIMDGVVSLTTSSFYNNTGLTDGAVEVAQWDDATPLVATNPHTVAINVWPGDGYYWSGDFPTLIHNAINYAAGGAFWLSVYPDSGELAPYSDTFLDVRFDAKNSVAGSHEGTIIIRSNDPDDSRVSVSVLLHVTNAPDIAVDFDSLDFDIVYIGYPESLALAVSNQGTDTLTVSDIVSDATEFSVDFANFVLAPDEDTIVYVTFAPASIGEVWSNLVISSDDPDESTLMVVLGGEGLICPDIWVDPDSVSDSLFTGETYMETLTVGNSGGSPLYVEVELDNFVEPTTFLSGHSIQELLGSRGERNPTYDPDAPTTAGLYASGEDGFSNIVASPGDVLASWPAPSPIQLAWGLGFDGSKVWVSDLDGVTDSEVDTSGVLLSWFSCSGWAGAWAADIAWDGHYIWQVNVGGDNDIYQLDPATGDVLDVIHDPGHTWDAISQRGLAYDKREDVFYIGGWNQDVVYKIKGPGWDNPGEILNFFYFPSVSGLAWHPGGTLWIAVNAGADRIFQVYPETGDIISQFLAPGDGSGYEGAGLAMDKRGNLWCISQTTQMAYLVESGVPAYTWLEVAPWACTLEVGETRELEVGFDAADLFGGDYSADIIISSNDCDQPSLTIPATFRVTGIPDITISEDTLSYGIIFVGYSLSDTLIISNQGSGVLIVSDIHSDNSDYTVDITAFSLAPGDSQQVSVTFAPTTEGEILGTLTIESSDADEPILTVALLGEGLRPPDIAVSVDSLSEALFTGQTVTGLLTISNDGFSDLNFAISVTPSLSSLDFAKIIRERHQQNLLPIHDEPIIPEKSSGRLIEYRRSERVSNDPLSRSIAEINESMDPSGGWESRSPMNEARAQLGLVAHPDGKIYAFGGYAGSSKFSSLEIYNPTTDSWSFGSPMPDADWGMATALDNNENIYSFTSRQSGSFRYDPVLDEWTTISSPPVIWVWGAGAATGLDGRIYLVGGEGPFSLVQIYDPDTDSWVMGSPMPTPRYQLGVVAGPGGFIYAIGGRSSVTGSPSNVVELYDPLTDTWSGATPMPTARNQFALSLGADGKIYAVGGKTSFVNNYGPFLDTLEIYDPATDTWQTGPPLPTARGEMEGVLCGDGIYAIGGTNGSFLAVNEVLQTFGWLFADTISGTIPASSSADIQITFNARGLDGGDYDANIDIFSNDPDESIVIVPAHLYVTDAPDIAISQDTLVYGVVFIGTSIIDTLIVLNQGTEILTVSGVSSDHSAYNVNPTSFSLDPGESQKVPVTFMPSTTGDIPGTLTITSDDPDESSLTVSLQGEGAEPPDISVSPGSLSDSLLTDETSIHLLTISNPGISDLIFDISIEEIIATATPLTGDPTSQREDAQGRNLNGEKKISSSTDLHSNNSEIIGKTPPQIIPYKGSLAASSQGALFVVDESDLYIVELNPATGEVINSFPVPEVAWGAIGLAFDGTYLYFVTGFGSNTIYQLDRSTGEVIETADVEGLEDVQSLGHSGDALYALGVSSNRIYRIDFETASIVDQHTFEFYLDGGITFGGNRGTIFVLDYEEWVYEIDPSNWQVIRRFLPPDLDWIYGLGYSQALGVLFLSVAYHPNILYAVNPDDGTVIFSHQLPNTYPIGVAADEAAGVPWLSAEPRSDTLSSGSSIDIGITFDAARLNRGNYNANLVISSNDPDEPNIRVPAHLRTTGIPNIVLPQDTLDYDIVFIGTSGTDTLVVFNAGTDSLMVSDIASDNSAYTVDTTSFSLDFGESQEVLVTFAPTAEEQILGTLTIESNDPDQPIVTVALRGEGLIAPDIAVSPDSLEEDLFRGDTSTQLLTIYNDGESDLNFKVRIREINQDLGFGQVHSETILRQPGAKLFHKVSGEKASYEVEYSKGPTQDPKQKEMSLSGDSVELAGEYSGDHLHFGITEYGEIEIFQYPVGNDDLWGSGYTVVYMLNDSDYVSWARRGSREGIMPISYMELVNDSSQVMVEVVTQTIDGLLEIARTFAFRRNDKYVNIQTNLRNISGSVLRDVVFKSFADWDLGEYPSDDDWDYDLTRNMVYAWDSIYAAVGSEQVPDLMDIQGWNDYRSRATLVDFPTGPIFDYDGCGLLHFELGNLSPGISAIITTAYGAGDSLADLQGVIDRGLEFGYWVLSDPSFGMIPPHSNLPIFVQFNTGDLNGGDYNADIVLLSNDPDEPEVGVPVHLHVTGIPDIAVSDSALDYDSVFIGVSVTDTLTVSNQGTDLLTVNDISSDNSDYIVGTTSFTLNPGENQEVVITFAPSSNGEISSTLTIESDDPDEPAMTVALQGQGLIPPDIAVSSDSLRESILVGHTSVQILTILNEGPSELTFDISYEEQDAFGEDVQVGIQGAGKRLHPEKDEKLLINDGGVITTPSHAKAFSWRPENPSVEIKTLIYADDGVHTTPNTFPDQALQHLGLAYTAYYDGDFTGFEAGLTGEAWDLVLFANDARFFPPATTLTALKDYVNSGGRLIFHGWTVGLYADDPLWTVLGFTWVANDDPPPDSVYWWDITDPIFNHPQSVPEFTSLDNGNYLFYGQSVKPLANFQALAGYTTPGPDSNKAAMIRGNDNRTLFKGFVDGQNSADLDGDSMLDGVELWMNLIVNTARAGWLSLDPTSGAIPGFSGMDIAVMSDASGILVGDYFADLTISSNDPDKSEVAVAVYMRAIERGDANADFSIGLSDIVYLINYLFKSGWAPDPVEAGDVNCDSKVDIIDAVYLINYLFKDGPPPCP